MPDFGNGRKGMGQFISPRRCLLPALTVFIITFQTITIYWTFAIPNVIERALLLSAVFLMWALGAAK